MSHQTDYELDRFTYQYAAAKIDPDTTTADLNGPGRYETASDRVLAWTLDVLYGAGASDEVAGDVDSGLHMARFGRHVLSTDSQGFLYVDVFESESLAVEALDAATPGKGPTN